MTRPLAATVEPVDQQRNPVQRVAAALPAGHPASPHLRGDTADGLWRPRPPRADVAHLSMVDALPARRHRDGAPSAAPSSAHWFGTDSVGSDVFSRTVAAGRTDVLYTLAVVAIALLIGSVWGAIVGFFGGRLEWATLRLLEVLQAFPALLMALFIISIVGPGTVKRDSGRRDHSAPRLRPPRPGRSADEEELAIRRGGQHGRQPADGGAVQAPDAEQLPAPARLRVGQRCLGRSGNIAALGYIGLGIQPDAVEWGSMIARGQSDVVSGAWWESFFPGIGILLLAIGFQLVGDGLSSRNRGERR